MAKNLKRKFESKIENDINERLVNLIVALLGVLLVIVGAVFWLLKSQEIFITISMSVGTSLIASAVVTYLTSIYIYKRKKEKDITEFWGLNAVYESRQRMNDLCDSYLEDVEEVLDIIAFGLRSFRHSRKHLIEKKVRQGLKIRILTIHPDSIFLKQREQDEKVTPGYIRETIIQLYDWVRHLKEKLAKNPDDISIQFYDALPLDFYFRVDDVLFVGPYLYGKDSQQTISFEFRSNAKGFSDFVRYFEDLWGQSVLPKKTYEVVN
jgi:hypothetical protein